MAQADDAPVWVPTQERVRTPTDFRHATVGPRGFKVGTKRSRDEAADAAEEAVPASMEVDAQHTDKRVKVSSTAWRRPPQTASRAACISTSTSWARKMADRDSRRAFRAVKVAAEEASKEKRKAVGAARRAARERKEANRARSQVVQKVTKASTLKKMMKNKKLKKKLRTADV